MTDTNLFAKLKKKMKDTKRSYFKTQFTNSTNKVKNNTEYH
jgi:ribosomal protein L29